MPFLKIVERTKQTRTMARPANSCCLNVIFCTFSYPLGILFYQVRPIQLNASKFPTSFFHYTIAFSKKEPASAYGRRPVFISGKSAVFGADTRF